MAGEILYNDPLGGAASEVGTQIRTDHFIKKALIDAKKEQYFSQLSGTTNMPKNMGKKIKKFHYMPMLDDRNINDQGLDASGAVLTAGTWSAIDAAGVIISSGHASRAIAMAVGTAVTAVEDGGNLYGSSKDIGAITGKLPALSETGGRVNRVGFKRLELEGSIEKFGFFDEYSQESMDFDSDAQLEQHIHREMILGANEITEDALQIDLLNAAGVLRYGGIATQDSEITGEGADLSVVDYGDLMRLSIDLDNNRCPKHTKIITGTRLIDTKVIDAARIMYIGSELIPTVKKMVDSFSEKAFIPVQKYAANGDVLTGEIGTIDQFRIVVVPEMLHWTSRGAAETIANAGYRATSGKYDVFPMLVVGDGSFTTIGFQTDGKTVKFKVVHKKPGIETADRNDPYGETGFMSIKWYYGMLLERPERIACVKTVAEL